MALTWQLANTVLGAISRRYQLNSTHAGIEKALAVIRLYKEILEDGNYGFGHYAMSALYARCARCAADQGLDEEAEKYLRSYYEHSTAYQKLRRQGGEFSYTASLAAGVTVQLDTLPPAQKWEKSLDELPEKLQEIWGRISSEYELVI